MAVNDKYRVHDVAKDFGVSNNVVIELLSKYFSDEKKHMTALTDEELDVVFDVFTQENQVKSFNEYFAAVKQAPKEDKPAKKEQSKKAASDKPAGEEKKEEKPAQKPADKPASKTAEPKKDKKGKAVKQPTGRQSEVNPFKKHVKDANRTPQARTKGQMRTVDTRTTVVDLEKYNERYDDMSQFDKVNVNDRSNANKQKLKKKNNSKFRSQGTHKKGKRETEAQRLARIEAERKKKKLVVKIPDEITVIELASVMKITVTELIKKLMTLGVMASQNDVIDFDTASIVAEEFHIKCEKMVVVSIEEQIIDDTTDDDENLEPRSPIVVVMGHVDHGKTSILDCIRNTSVTATEAGGITQAIGAYQVTVNGQNITFLDTPGHAAFTAMRARGAMATDVAVLVVAADDGIMPQTIEAINHAKAANVSIIVAINKMDKEGANPERIKQQLTEHELVPEEWGGDTICVPVSAKTRQGIDELLETILLVSEMRELKANPNRAAKGVVVEAKLDKGRGPVATLLVQNGTLNAGDIVVAGTTVGRIRVMNDENGRRVKSAGPSVPVEITGLDEVPQAGDTFDVASDERLARQLVEQRKEEMKKKELGSAPKVNLDNLFASLQEGEIKTLNIVVKGDVQGSVEAVKQSLEKLSNDEVKVSVIHSGVGGITESDVMLANASNAIIVGFNVRPDATAKENAARDKVDIRCYRIIYDCIEEIEAAMKSMLAPKFRDVDIGTAQVRQTITISKVGTIAGCYVTEGKVQRNAKIRLVRDGVIIAEDEMSSLRRFKDDVKEVQKGFECGIGLTNFNDIKEGDIFEAYITEEYRD